MFIYWRVIHTFDDDDDDDDDDDTNNNNNDDNDDDDDDDDEGTMDVSRPFYFYFMNSSSQTSRLFTAVCRRSKNGTWCRRTCGILAVWGGASGAQVQMEVS